MNFRSAYWKLKHEVSNLNDGQIYQILEFISQRDKTWILENWETEILQQEAFDQIFEKTKTGYPLAYLFKDKVFLGHHFYIDETVLIPRDETELIVNEANKWLKNFPKSQVLDLCTGSGVIGLSLKLNNPHINLTISDISKSALKVAQKNSQELNLRVNILQGDFLDPVLKIGQKFNLIICNPPYVSRSSPLIGSSTKFEPQKALFPIVDDALHFYRTFFNNAKPIIDLQKPFAIFFEFGYDQKDEINELINKTLWLKNSKVQFLKDWAGHWRFVKILGGLKINA